MHPLPSLAPPSPRASPAGGLAQQHDGGDRREGDAAGKPPYAHTSRPFIVYSPAPSLRRLHSSIPSTPSTYTTLSTLSTLSTPSTLSAPLFFSLQAVQREWLMLQPLSCSSTMNRDTMSPAFLSALARGDERCDALGACSRPVDPLLLARAVEAAVGA